MLQHSSGLGPHTTHRFDDELEHLRDRVLRMGGLVEDQLRQAITALLGADLELAARIINDDDTINDMKSEIGEICISILATRAPVASDLRLVIAVINVINDLERMGDESVQIARMALQIAEHTELQPAPDANRVAPRYDSNGNVVPSFGGVGEVNDHFSPRYDSDGNPAAGVQLDPRCVDHLASRVRLMLHDALNAFSRLDVDLAVRITQQDQVVDCEYQSLSSELIDTMTENVRLIPIALDIQWSAKALESIGDRVCNICEYIFFLVQGKNLRDRDLEFVAADQSPSGDE